MIQQSSPLPADAPVCQPGHRPQLIETRGTPQGYSMGAPCPPLWHIECAICGIATVPHPLQHVTKVRWAGHETQQTVPLHQLRHARERVAAEIAERRTAISLDTLGPTPRHALLAAIDSEDQTFRRSAGGWCVILKSNGQVCSFTVRTIRAMSRDWLIDLSDEFAEVATLTRKGLELATLLRDVNAEKAGAA